MKTPQIFADGIAEVGFAAGAVRIDLYSLAQETGQNKPERVVTERIIMTPQGLIESLAALEGMANKLVEIGVLARADKPAETAPTLAPAAPAAEAPTNGVIRPVSPNFG